MPEPLKNLLNQSAIELMAEHFNKHSSSFDKTGFINEAIKDLDSLELKQRTDRVTDVMVKYFPKDFKEAGQLILSSLGPNISTERISSGTVDSNGIAGWPVMSLVSFVARQGKNEFDESMALLKELTSRSSSEFGIRFFILDQPDKTLAAMKEWAVDAEPHVRRLASEGCRPRLPWAMRLPIFIEDPSPVIEILEMLKDDESEYVRRSVANNLNDIAKDHPDLVADIAESWLVHASKERQKLVKHACRTLIKDGHKKTLAAFGFKPPKIDNSTIKILTPELKFGEALEFTLTLESGSMAEQAFVIDYVIHHRKANGQTSPKVFKWVTTSLHKDQELSISKSHAIKKITTRTYYEGLHSLEIMINGVSVGRRDFNLMM